MDLHVKVFSLSLSLKLLYLLGPGRFAWGFIVARLLIDYLIASASNKHLTHLM